MDLGIRAPMCSLTGYAEYARNVVRSLSRLGVNIFLELLDYRLYKTTKAALPLNVTELIEKLRRSVPADIPSLTIGTPPQYEPEHKGLKIGIGLFEALSVPVPWLTSMNRMDLILTLSSFNKEVFVRQGLSRGKVEIIPPAVDSDRFSPEANPFYVGVVRPFTILFVGQLILRKGWDKLLIAALRAFRTHDDVCVVLKLPPARSRGHHDETMKLLREVKREAGGSKVPVYFNDYAIPVEQIPRVYQIARKKVPKRIYRFLNGEPPKGVFALPSLGEGIGLPYLEAQASGLLVLGTCATGQEFLSPENAVIVESGPPIRNIKLELESTVYRGAPFPAVSVEAVADALRRAYNLDLSQRTMIESTARAQAGELTYDKCTRRILDTIESRL